jgi:hypothetical protein
VVLDKCEDDEENFYVDLSVVNIGSLVDSPVLEFVDGVSAKDPTSTLTDCRTYPVAEEEADTCCKGGASFLKVRVGNTAAPGILTADSTLVVPSDCSYDQSTNTVRFVSCSDDCLDPFGSQACTDAWGSVAVFAGAEICFGVWDEEEKRIDFGSKMPTNLNLFYIEDTEGLIQSAELHTSCSKPLEAPYAQPFTEDCDPSVAGEPLNLGDISSESQAFYLAFVDGVSLGELYVWIFLTNIVCHISEILTCEFSVQVTMKMPNSLSKIMDSFSLTLALPVARALARPRRW